MINRYAGAIAFRNFVSFFSIIEATILSRCSSLCGEILTYLKMKKENVL